MATLFEYIRTLGKSAAFSFKQVTQSLYLHALYGMHNQALFSAD